MLVKRSRSIPPIDAIPFDGCWKPRKIYAMAYWKLGSRYKESPHDALQHVYEKMSLKKEELTKPDVNIHAWAYRVACNHVLNIIRNSKQNRYTNISLDCQPAFDIAPEFSEQERKIVRIRLNKLKPIFRVVIQARYLDDLSVEETADKLGITKMQVRSRAARGLSQLRELYPDRHGYSEVTVYYVSHGRD